jgi:hypothetical protein
MVEPMALQISISQIDPIWTIGKSPRVGNTACDATEIPFTRSNSSSESRVPKKCR